MELHTYNPGDFMITALQKRLVPIVFLLPISGCASIVNGTNEALSVQTITTGAPVTGAQCELTNGKGTWFVQTPGSVTVHRAYGKLSVGCSKPGFEKSMTSVGSVTKALALGNVFFGGLVGAGVDMSDGAAYSYPKLITVPMKPAIDATKTPDNRARQADSPQPVD